MRTKIKRALLSVYDKTDLIDLAKGLHELGVEVVSSGNTSTALEAAGIPVTRVEAVTGSPEMLDGRVKTLHPKIHGGLLADLGNDPHRRDLDLHGILPFELVVSNLYPFEQRPDIETIDIGGPAMTRAAAKNHAWVTIVTSPDQYGPLLTELHANDGTVGDETRRAFALEAFARTAAYDAAIVQWLQEQEPLPEHIVVALERTDEKLRYGENPHQQGARYRRAGTTSWWDETKQHAGLALSYLNYYDTDAAWKLVHDLGDGPACAIIKHANPCGVALDGTLDVAYQRALECDERSAFGGIVALNRPIDAATVARMVEGPQADVVIAPGYEDGVDRSAVEEAQEHAAPRGSGARRRPPGLPPDLGRLPRPGRTPLRVDPQRLARRHQGCAHARAVARPRARVAHLRAREVECDRAREGRSGGRHRRGTAEPRRVGRDRGEEGRGSRQGRCGRERRVLSVRRRRGGGRGRRSRSGDPTRRRPARRDR